jgi:hypothetical protein
MSKKNIKTLAVNNSSTHAWIVRYTYAARVYQVFTFSTKTVLSYSTDGLELLQGSLPNESIKDCTALSLHFVAMVTSQRNMHECSVLCWTSSGDNVLHCEASLAWTQYPHPYTSICATPLRSWRRGFFAGVSRSRDWSCPSLPGNLLSLWQRHLLPTSRRWLQGKQNRGYAD